MAKQLLQLGPATLCFTKTGTGQHVLLAFHGFGQNSHVFDELSAAISHTYTLYLFDIFFHANSEWAWDEQPLEKELWTGLIKKLLDEQSITRFSLLGFSMGGKFALATLEAFPQRVNEIFLLAPDGIKTNIWYRLATYPLALRKFFKSMILNPHRFNAIINFASRAGLIDKGVRRFAESQMNTEEKRKRVYYSWIVFRHLKFNLVTIANLINQNNIKLVIILGKFDKIITVKNMNQLLRYVTRYQLEIPETGHSGIISASINIFKKILATERTT